MAKNNKQKGRKKQPQQKVAKDSVAVEKMKGGDEDAITWDDIAAMSDSEDESGTEKAVELNTKAKNLRQAITKNLNGLLTSLKKKDAEGEEEFEEDDLDGSSTEGGEDDDEDEKVLQNEPEEEEDGDMDVDNSKSFIDQIAKKSDADEDNDSDSDEETEEEKKNIKKMEKYTTLENNNNINSKALSVVAAELTAVHSKMPWAETFVIVPPTPLPFGQNGDPESNPLDIHDDLKREVAFYNTALEAVNQARSKCQEFDIPFTRPDDFFAEMVKTDGKYRRRKNSIERIRNSLLRSQLLTHTSGNCFAYFTLLLS